MEDEHCLLMFLVSFRRLLGRPRGVVLHSALQVVFLYPRPRVCSSWNGRSCEGPGFLHLTDPMSTQACKQRMTMLILYMRTSLLLLWKVLRHKCQLQPSCAAGSGCKCSMHAGFEVDIWFSVRFEGRPFAASTIPTRQVNVFTNRTRIVRCGWQSWMHRTWKQSGNMHNVIIIMFHPDLPVPPPPLPASNEWIPFLKLSSKKAVPQIKYDHTFK